MIAGTPKTNDRAYIIESCDGTSQQNNGHSKKTSAPPNQYYLIRQAITTITAAISNSTVSHPNIYASLISCGFRLRLPSHAPTAPQLKSARKANE